MPNNIDVWKQQVEPQMREVDGARRQSFQSAFKGADDATFISHTGKREKADAQQQLIEHYAGIQLLQVLLYENSDLEEIKSPDAKKVAEWKAIQALGYGRSIQGDSRAEVIAAGADVNAFLIGPNGEIQEHKYSRQNSEVLRINREKIRKSIIETYSTPPNGLVHIRWDLGTHFINGTDHQFGDQIEIRSAPVDMELLIKALDDAEANGLYLSSNLHFAAIECLQENGKIYSVAFLPHELRVQGVTLEQVRQTPTEGLINLAKQSIVTNVPVRYQ